MLAQGRFVPVLGGGVGDDGWAACVSDPGSPFTPVAGDDWSARSRLLRRQRLAIADGAHVVDNLPARPLERMIHPLGVVALSRCLAGTAAVRSFSPAARDEARGMPTSRRQARADRDETAAAVPEQHAEAVASAVGRHDVRSAVAAEVIDGECDRAGATREAPGGRERQATRRGGARSEHQRDAAGGELCP